MGWCLARTIQLHELLHRMLRWYGTEYLLFPLLKRRWIDLFLCQCPTRAFYFDISISHLQLNRYQLPTPTMHSTSPFTDMEDITDRMEQAVQSRLSESCMEEAELPPYPAFDNTDPEARMCTMCWVDIQHEDALWIATDCKTHQHIFHADCVAAWWYSSGRRACPRCVQPVDGFTVYARTASGTPLFRTYKAADPNDNRVAMQHIIVDQSPLLEDLASSNDNSIDSCVATCNALAPWQKPEMLAGDGTTRSARVGRACHDFLATTSFENDALVYGEWLSLKK